MKQEEMGKNESSEGAGIYTLVEFGDAWLVSLVVQAGEAPLGLVTL